MKMKLSKALSKKNTLARKILDLQVKIRTYNSFLKGNTPVYQSKDMLKELHDTTEELMSIKTAINIANGPIQNKIFRLSELKSFASFLRKLEIKDRLMFEPYHTEIVQEWQAGLGIIERDQIVVETEKKIGDIQSELDRFNFETEV